MTKISACIYAAVIIVVTLAFSALINVSQADEWKTTIIPVASINTSPQALYDFMKDHGEDISITGNRISDCDPNAKWLAGYGVVIKVFKKTSHPEFRPAIICQDTSGDYYIQPDNAVIIEEHK